MRAGSWGSNAFICLYAGLAAAIIGKVIPLVGAIDVDLQTTPAQSAWLISLVTAVGILVAPFAGRLSVRFGDRQVLAAGLAIEVLGSSLSAVAPTFALLLAGRIVEGLAFFLILNSAMTLLMKTNDGPRRSAATGLFIACVPLGIGISAVLSAQALGFGWRAVFWAHAAIMAVALLGCPLLPKPAVVGHAPHGSHGFFSAYRRLPPIWLGLIIALLSVAQLGSTSLLPSFLMQTYSLTIGEAAGVSSIGQIIGIAGNVFASVLLARGLRGSRIGLISLLVAAPLALFIFLPGVGLEGNAAAYLALLLLCGCAGSALASLAPMIAESPERIGETNAVLNQVNSLGLLVGPPLMFASFGGAGSVGPSVVAIACVAIPVLLLLGSGLHKADRRETSTEAPAVAGAPSVAAPGTLERAS